MRVEPLSGILTLPLREFWWYVSTIVGTDSEDDTTGSEIRSLFVEMSRNGNLPAPLSHRNFATLKLMVDFMLRRAGRPCPYGRWKPISLGGQGNPAPTDDGKPISLGEQGNPAPTDDGKPISLGGQGNPAPTDERVSVAEIRKELRGRLRIRGCQLTPFGCSVLHIQRYRVHPV